MEVALNDEQLQEVYTWVDQIPLSRPKRNMARDFSDGVLFAEIVNHYHPKLLELHNYTTANGLAQKTYNWETLQKKVLKKLKFPLSREEIEDVVNSKPGVVEILIYRLRSKLASYQPPVRTSGSNFPGAPSPEQDSYANVRSTPTATRFSASPMKSPAKSLPPQRSSPESQPRQASPAKFAQRDTSFEDDRRNSHSNQSSRVPENIQMLLHEKDQTILELRDTINILELKIKRLEQLVQLKDSKIAALQKHWEGQ